MTGVSRRELALALLSLAASAGPAFPQAPRDQGIGGTGAAPKPPTIGDRGIGGTGVIGTIRRFGSIYVNDLRIAYPAGAEVVVDGARARTSDMKIGHVVQTIATGPENALATQRIEIASEVIGPVEKLVPNGMIVLGQTVDLRALKTRGAFKPGAFVAIFGQRRGDGVIVASLVEGRSPGRTKIAGPLLADASGRLSIGGMLLRGVPAGLAGSRVSVEGAERGDVYNVSSFRSLARPFGPEVGRVSVEGYLAPGGRRLGSGLAISGTSGTRGGAGPVIISGHVAPSGGFIADRIRQNTGLQLPERGGPAALQPPTGSGLLPGLGGDTGLGGSGGLLPGQPGGLMPSAPNLGLPGGLAPSTPNLGLPGGIGLPGIRR